MSKTHLYSHGSVRGIQRAEALRHRSRQRRLGSTIRARRSFAKQARIPSRQNVILITFLEGNPRSSAMQQMCKALHKLGGAQIELVQVQRRRQILCQYNLDHTNVAFSDRSLVLTRKDGTLQIVSVKGRLAPHVALSAALRSFMLKYGEYTPVVHGFPT